MTSTIICLALCLYLLVCYRWHRALEAADYWRSIAFRQQVLVEQQNAAIAKHHYERCMLYKGALVAVGDREALWGMVNDAGRN